MKIKENIPLAQYTTFKIGGPARFFCNVLTENGLIEAVNIAKGRNLPIFVLGGGSNILVSDDGYSGMVIKVEMIGKETHEINKDEIVVSAAAGEIWDDLVDYAVQQGLYGIENLSAIPGTVGATPVQNIGAYGADVSKVIVSVRALDTKTMKFVDISNIDCKFEYRDSSFKHEKGRYIITRVDFKLSRTGKVNTSYKDLSQYFAEKKIVEPTLRQVRDAVIDIRWCKLPDWKLWGTAGSYFKNPVITKAKFDQLKSQYPEMTGYPEPDGRIKVSLAWVLDKVCNVKEASSGSAHTYEKQALVVVTKPGASATDVVQLTQKLMKCVKEKTGIEIEAEVEWVN